MSKRISNIPVMVLDKNLGFVFEAQQTFEKNGETYYKVDGVGDSVMDIKATKSHVTLENSGVISSYLENGDNYGYMSKVTSQILNADINIKDMYKSDAFKNDDSFVAKYNQINGELNALDKEISKTFSGRENRPDACEARANGVAAIYAKFDIAKDAMIYKEIAENGKSLEQAKNDVNEKYETNERLRTELQIDNLEKRLKTYCDATVKRTPLKGMTDIVQGGIMSFACCTVGTTLLSVFAASLGPLGIAVGAMVGIYSLIEGLSKIFGTYDKSDKNYINELKNEINSLNRSLDKINAQVEKDVDKAQENMDKEESLDAPEKPEDKAEENDDKLEKDDDKIENNEDEPDNDVEESNDSSEITDEDYAEIERLGHPDPDAEDDEDDSEGKEDMEDESEENEDESEEDEDDSNDDSEDDEDDDSEEGDDSSNDEEDSESDEDDTENEDNVDDNSDSEENHEDNPEDNDKEADLDAREQALNDREQALNDREQALNDREQALDNKEADLDAREKDLESKENNLENKVDNIENNSDSKFDKDFDKDFKDKKAEQRNELMAFKLEKAGMAQDKIVELNPDSLTKNSFEINIKDGVQDDAESKTIGFSSSQDNSRIDTISSNGVDFTFNKEIRLNANENFNPELSVENNLGEMILGKDTEAKSVGLESISGFLENGEPYIIGYEDIPLLPEDAQDRVKDALADVIGDKAAGEIFDRIETSKDKDETDVESKESIENDMDADGDGLADTMDNALDDENIANNSFDDAGESNWDDLE